MMKMQGEETLQCFNRRTDSLKFIVFFLWLITGRTGSASRRLTFQTGGSLIIPCYYDRKYTDHKKYWCFHAKSYYNYCSILAYANETKGRVSVIDHPDQSFFTVTMRNLQHEDTGAYWCVVEIGGLLEIDESEQLYLTVQSAPDVSVVNSSVSGHEGGDISVQCFYSSGNKNKVKQWCRYKDQSCYTVGRTNTSQNSSVQISDDGRRSFTVLMTGLRLTDSGWYYCSVGDMQVPVHLLVQRDNESKTESDDAGQFPSTCKNQTASKDSEDSKCSPNDPSDQMDWIFLLFYTAVPLLLLLMLVLVIWRLVQKHNGSLTKRGPDICSVAEGQKAVTYDTVVFKKANKHEPNQVSISHSPEQFEVIYSTLNLHQ